MSAAIAVPCTVIGLSALFLVRNQIVFKFRRRRIDEIHAANQRDVNRDDFMALMNRRYRELDDLGYDSMLFDLTRWSYRQFFPQEVA